jgi:hypothetical protein
MHYRTFAAATTGPPAAARRLPAVARGRALWIGWALAALAFGASGCPDAGAKEPRATGAASAASAAAGASVATDGRDPGGPPAVAAPIPPAEPEAPLRIEWRPGGGGAARPAPALDQPFAVPAGGRFVVHLQSAATAAATATLLDPRGRPIPQRSQVYAVGAGVRIELELLEESPPRALSLVVRAEDLERTIPVRIEAGPPAPSPAEGAAARDH